MTHKPNWSRVSSREIRTASGVVREHLNEYCTQDMKWPPVLVGGELIGYARDGDAALECAESWTGVYGDDLRAFPIIDPDTDRTVAYVLV